MMLASLALLSACATSGRVTDPAHVCAGWKAVYVSQGDVLTEGTAQQIEAHNEFGAKQGCW